MSTAVPLPLEAMMHEDAESIAAVSQQQGAALRRAVTERLEQHRRKRGDAGTWHMARAQQALPGMESHADEKKAAHEASRIADSVAARFAKTQTYRDFLQQEAETATRQAEAAAEIARRNADAVAAAQQELLEEMREWEQRQAKAPEQPVAPLEAAPVAGVVLPMAAAPVAVTSPPLLAPSESARACAVPAHAAAQPSAEPETPAAPVSIRIALGLEEPTEPTTPIHANLIEFPRQLVAARKARPRLAEGPLRDEADAQPERAQLRIFEVEAEAFSTTPTAQIAASLPEWSSIRLDGSLALQHALRPDAELSLALPVYAAPLERRLMAAAVDGCCIVTAFLLAVAAAGLAGATLPTGVLAAGISAVSLLVLGVSYLLLCFTFSEHTAGMRYARIALCTFGDDNPTRSAMRRRLFAMGLSTVSLGLGFAWALLDDEKLGWHDRISRMYQRAY